MKRTALAALGVTVITASGAFYLTADAAQRPDMYGPPVAPAVIITTDADNTPPAEQGEGGPDTLEAEPWLVPAGQCDNVRTLLARHDITGPTADRLVWIAQRESDCGATPVNRTAGDYGVWQINWATWGATLCRHAGVCTTPYLLAHDDDTQTDAARWILEWQGWSAWCWATPDHIARGIGYHCPWETDSRE
jgi:hypothetical protein